MARSALQQLPSNSTTIDNNKLYVRQSMAAPLLSREYEHELAVAWKDHGDEVSLHKLVQAYGRLVISMASRFRNFGLPLSDLMQEGNVGLLQAAARFEPDRDVRFSTYATWWIRAAMQDYILRNWSIVRTGTTSSQKSLFFNLRRLRARIANRTGETDLTQEGRQSIARDLGVPLHDVVLMEQRLAGNDHSLNAPMTEESEQSWQDLLVDDRPTPEEQTMTRRDAAARTAWLKTALDRLSEREQVIIRARKLSEGNITLEAMGKRLGISKERVRQLETRAMEKLKVALLKTTCDPDALLG